MSKFKEYDYLIVGSGLSGAIFAYEATRRGKKCLVVEKREEVGGNIRCEEHEGIHVHAYGAHIFHTSNQNVWNYVNQFTTFNNYINSPLAFYKGKLFNLPFNMNTFYQLWGTRTPQEAKDVIEKQKKEYSSLGDAANLEEQALSLCGKDIYECLIKGYTEKQWGRLSTELPASIIRRIPMRFTFNNNYFDDLYQGIPTNGYNIIIQKMLDGIEVMTDCNFIKNRTHLESLAEKVVYTGCIDEFFNYQHGSLEYRSLRFDTQFMECPNFQGNAVINYTERDVPYTRIIEHKHFEFGNQPHTIITHEYSMNYQEGCEPYYPINDEQNMLLYQKYVSLAQERKDVLFCGRLAEYKYYDMDDTVESVLNIVKQEFKEGI